MKKTAELRQLLADPSAIMVPGVYDAVTARLVQYAGFKMCATTGFGLHGALLGAPDVGLLAFNEVLNAVGNIVNSVDIPVTADCESGYGNAVNTIRTVQAFERTGLAGLFIEDQKLPPNCPYLSEPELISTDEMVGKIHAALDSRADKNFLIIARSDAPVDEGIERAAAFIEAGADMVMLIPRTRADIERIPQKVNFPLRIAYSPATPEFEGLTAWDLGTMGYKMVSFPISPLFINASATLKLLKEIKATGTDAGLLGEMMPYNEFVEIMGAEKFRIAEQKYLKK